MVEVTEGDMLGLVGVYCYVLAVIVLTVLLRDRMRNPRKLVHILTGGIVFFWWSFDTAIIMAGLAALPFVALLLLATPRSPVRFLRESPLGVRSAEGHPYGLVMYATSWTIIAYFMFDHLYAASLAIAAMSFGDGMGELVGRRFGRHVFMPHRSVEGSLAVLIGTLVSFLVVTWFYFDVVSYAGGGGPPEFVFAFAAAIAVLVTLLEAATPGSVDNLVIPLSTAGLLLIMGV